MMTILQRSIGLTALLFTALGGIIGSGWLFGPLFVAKIAGPGAILSWIIGGLMMTVINFTFAELSANHPMAGGMVRFAQLSHGPLMSFTVGWLVWLSSVAVAPVETLALLQYANNYSPGLMHTIQGTGVLSGKGLGAAALLLFAITAINFYTVKIFSHLSSIMVIIKVIVPILVIIVLLSTDFHPQNFIHENGFLPFGWHGVLAALPIGGVIFSFLGNSSAIQLAAEARNPKIALPLAIVGSVCIGLILYALLQIAFIGALKPVYLIHGWQQLTFAGQTGPFAGIVAALGITWLVILIYADAAISPFGTAFIYTAATGRVNYALAKINFFPKLFQRLNTHGSPANALLFNYLVGLVLLLPFPNWQKMVGFIVSCFVISYSIGPLALLPLRQTLSDKENKFRLPAGHIFALIAFYFCNLMIYWAGWEIIRRLLIALAVGGGVFLWQYWRNSSQWQKSLWQTAKWLAPYLIGLGVISYLGAFGGKHVLTFGPDVAVIFIFSLIIYALAMRYAIPEKAEKLSSVDN